MAGVTMDTRWQRLAAGKALAVDQREAAGEWQRLAGRVAELEAQLRERDAAVAPDREGVRDGA